MLGTILGILWFILKIILWIILGLLALVLLLILMVLLVPIRYQLEGSKYDTINARGKVTYLLRLIRVTFDYSPEGYAYKVKVLFFTVLKESVQHEEDLEEPPKETIEESTVAVNESANVQSSVSQTVEAKPTEEMSEAAEIKETPEIQAGAEAIDETAVVEAASDESKASAEKPKEKAPKKKAPKKKADKKKAEKKKTEKKKGESPLDQFKRYYAFLREDGNRGVLKFIIRRLFGAIGSILPKKFYGNIHFGLDDPALTAYILGSVSIFYHKFKDSLTLTADFENPVMEGEVRIKGRIIPGIFVWTLIRIYLDPRVRRLIKEVRGKKVKKKKAGKSVSRSV